MDLYYNGTIVATPPAIIKTACKLHLADFPFDKKVCDIKFSRSVNNIEKAAYP